jgi:hypothetical protein
MCVSRGFNLSPVLLTSGSARKSPGPDLTLLVLSTATDTGHTMDQFAFVPCDACGMRSYVHVVLDVDDLPLSFCSHDWAIHADALLAYTVRTVDMRHLLHEAVS